MLLRDQNTFLDFSFFPLSRDARESNSMFNVFHFREKRAWRGDIDQTEGTTVPQTNPSIQRKKPSLFSSFPFHRHLSNNLPTIIHRLSLSIVPLQSGKTTRRIYQMRGSMVDTHDRAPFFSFFFFCLSFPRVSSPDSKRFRAHSWLPPRYD